MVEGPNQISRENGKRRVVVQADVAARHPPGRQLAGDEFRLYELIWQRTIASQMVDAKGLTLSVKIAATAAR